MHRNDPDALPPRTRKGRKPFKVEARAGDGRWWQCGAYATEAQAKQAVDAMNAKDKWFEYRMKE